jgi:NADPH-dependent 2,4-dienoyl-CoA reductase/sulfur reductase-like enzyme
MHRHYNNLLALTGCLLCRLSTVNGRPRLARTKAGEVPFSRAPAQAPEAAEPAPAVTPLYMGKKAVVVGAGPAGAVAAMFLARQGFTVDVSSLE